MHVATADHESPPFPDSRGTVMRDLRSADYHNSVHSPLIAARTRARR